MKFLGLVCHPMAMIFSRKREFVLLLVLYICVFSLCISYYFDKRELAKIFTKTQPQPKRKLITFSTKLYPGHPPFLDGTRSKCPKCIFSVGKIRFQSSDAVVFRISDLRFSPPVGLRKQNQVWVFLSLDPIVGWSSILKTKNYTGMFNWTMTHRLDSDVRAHYGRFVPFSEMPLPKYKDRNATLLLGSMSEKDYTTNFMRIPKVEELKGKKMAAWIATRCRSDSKREIVVEELSKFIKIDQYGNCGKLKCGGNHHSIDCKFEISNQYKFYLAFENSLCEDYVTKRYFDALLTQMVPVVYGGANYSRRFPYKSFISVLDFPTLEKLADYLKYLDGNDIEYLKYFDWRKNYWVMNNAFVENYCALCKKLWNHDSKVTKVYSSVTNWWSRRSDFDTSGRDACADPSDRLSEMIPVVNTTALIPVVTTTKAPYVLKFKDIVYPEGYPQFDI